MFPALLDHCSDQQVAIGSLIELTSRAHTDILAMRKAFQEMERRVTTYMEMGNTNLFGDGKGRLENEDKDTEVAKPATAAVAGAKSTGEPIPSESPQTSPRIQHHHRTFNRVLGHSLGVAEDPSAPTEIDRARTDESLATVLEGNAELLKFEEREDRPRVHFNVVLCGRTRPLHEVVDAFALFVVLLNTVFTWVQANVQMDNAYLGTPIGQWVSIIDVSFTLVFAMELSLRMWLMGLSVFFISGRDRGWNVLDCVFVSSSLLESVITFADLKFMRVMRVARVMRAFRALRGMRFVRELRLMLASIIASLASFVWGSFLIAFVMYVMALCLMQSLLFTDSGITAELYHLYGSVLTSMVTLFMAVSGGRDWADLLRPLDEVSPGYRYFYTVYIYIVLFGIMNVLTACFCENASHIAGVDHGLVIQDEVNRVKHDHERIKRCFTNADQDGNGRLSLAELEGFLDDPERRALLGLLAIDVSEARGLFELMDHQHHDEVDINDYVDAIMRLRGAAKGCDTAMLMFENKRMMIRMASLMCFVCENFRFIRSKLDTDGRALSLDRYLSTKFIEEKEAEAKQLIHKGLAAHLTMHADAVSGETHVTKLTEVLHDVIGFPGQATARSSGSSHRSPTLTGSTSAATPGNANTQNQEAASVMSSARAA